MTVDLAAMRRLLAAGAGIGVEIGREDLTVTAVRVRPSGARLLGAAMIAGFRERAAADWGSIYADFTRRAGARHLAATVLLPRSDVIVRLLTLPGVSNRDLASAIQFQIDSLHPFREEEVAYAWARVGGDGAVLVAITRKEVLDRYISLFAEAGVRIAAFTFSGAVLYSAARLVTRPPAGGFMMFAGTEEALEVYGESESKAVFSAALDLPRERATEFTAAELRLAPDVQPIDVAALLPAPKGAPEGFDFSRNALAYAAALAGACPRLALPLNLLPGEYRSSHSRLIYVPTAALAAMVLAGVVGIAAITPIEDRKYMRSLESEFGKFEPLARKAEALDRAIAAARERTRLLDGFRRRSKADMDAVLELTRILEPPGSLQSLDITRDSVVLSGSASQAALLLKLIDSSPYFQGSEFAGALTHSGTSDGFRIRAARKAVAQ
jgi:hypothetical protein